MTDPTISIRRARALKPVIDAAMALQRDGKLIAGLMVVLDVPASALVELIEAFKPEAPAKDG